MPVRLLRGALCKITRFDDRDPRRVDVTTHRRGDLIGRQDRDFLLELGVPLERPVEEEVRIERARETTSRCSGTSSGRPETML